MTAPLDPDRLIDQQLIDRRINATLPRTLRHVDLDALDRDGCSGAIDAARTWALNGGGLLLAGSVGVGKSTIAAGALCLRIRHGGRGDWISAPTLMADLAAGLGTPRHAQADMLIGGRAPIVVDDLDKIRPSEYGAEQVFRPIDGATTEDRALIVTTNLSLSELAARWPAPHGQAIASRLAGYCSNIVLAGADRRLRGAA